MKLSERLGTMTIITTRRDILTYAHSCTGDANVAERFAELLAEADHPLYGSDWSEWLADNADAILVECEDDAENGNVREFLGEADGNPWRVHMMLEVV